MSADVEVVVIGAGPAGLATGACAKRAGVGALLIDKEPRVASSWRAHYRRLHLHTVKRHSGLPYLPMPRSYPRYPSRLQVVEYLEVYARRFALDVRLGELVTRCEPREGLWETTTGRGVVRSRYVVVASGYNAVPSLPRGAGMDEFQGRILHSKDYIDPEPFAGKRVLVVGSGNSGTEIALDLAEAGVAVDLCVRGPVHVVPRDFLSRGTQETGILMSRLPRSVADLVGPFLARLALGDLRPLGIERPRPGPIAMILAKGRVPWIDVGTIARIKEGAIGVVPGMARFSAGSVHFVDGGSRPYEAVVMATGYRPGFEQFLVDAVRVTDERCYPLRHGEETALAGLFFVGFRNPPTGALRGIAIEARRVAAALRRGGR